MILRALRIRFGLPVAACLLFASCGPAARMAIRDQKRSTEIKKIAVLPFFNANSLSVEFISKGDSKSPFTADFVKEAKKRLSKRYQWVTGIGVEDALKKTGKYPGWIDEEGRHQRAGFTISEAIKAGKELNADAVIIGAGAEGERRLKKLYRSTMTIRLIDVQSGKVLWGATALKKGALDSTPSKKIVRQLSREML